MLPEANSELTIPTPAFGLRKSCGRW